MQNKICCIFAAGDYKGGFVPDEYDYIIAADAGYRHLEKMNICPDMLLGDFDTIGSLPNHENIVRFPVEKDYTDTELALIEGIKLGYSSFMIFGALGGSRLEHTLANIVLASSYSKRGYDITVSDGDYYIKAVTNSSASFDEKQKGFISVFCVDGKAEGVTETGLKYPLEDALIDSSNPTLCVSNEFIGQKSSISVKNGTILIMYQKR